MERDVVLEGCVNFRDLGGYPAAEGRVLRWRRLYRSDALHELSESDVARLRDELGITDVVDLRSTQELRAEGRGPLARERIAFHHHPIIEAEHRAQLLERGFSSLDEVYGVMAELAKPALVAVVDVLGSATGATVYHCAIGKDRTGVISALLLALLGVPEEVIAADYALSRENMDGILERVGRMRGQMALEEVPAYVFDADPRTIRALLAELRARYGSLEAYATSAGVERAAVEKLRETLLETPPHAEPVRERGGQETST